MPRGVFVVQSSPDPEQDAAFSEWYSNTHIPEVLQVPGFVSARRFRLVGEDASQHPYLAIYELDADDLGDAVQELHRRARSGQISPPVGMRFDPAPVTLLYELTD